MQIHLEALFIHQPCPVASRLVMRLIIACAAFSSAYADLTAHTCHMSGNGDISFSNVSQDTYSVAAWHLVALYLWCTIFVNISLVV